MLYCSEVSDLRETPGKELGMGAAEQLLFCDVSFKE